MTTPLYDHYMQSIKDALKNLEGEELEKCLTALNNYMKNFGEQNETIRAQLQRKED